ncbi:hypothetical protein SAMN03159288_03397 [Rhizobium sp. NFACC06-2]|nr:hypothetical protein SAMN03159288_03397 [Rhizobium sp. NFACC06-2]
MTVALVRVPFNCVAVKWCVGGVYLFKTFVRLQSRRSNGAAQT